MKIDLLCSCSDHPVNSWIASWVSKHSADHSVSLFRSKSELRGGDLLLLISCTEIIASACRDLYSKTLVLHASDLPKGRGWSPHVWQVIGGCTALTVVLLEAEDQVDSGMIWSKTTISIAPSDLFDEINNKLFKAEMDLLDFAVEHFENPSAVPQSSEIEPTYYPKRAPSDSEIDPHLSIAEQFNLLRVCDPVRFPAYFELHGSKFKIILEKVKDVATNSD